MNTDNNYLDEALRFEEMNIEIQLTDELSGSLRSLKVSSRTHWDKVNNLFSSVEKKTTFSPNTARGELVCGSLQKPSTSKYY